MKTDVLIPKFDIVFFKWSELQSLVFPGITRSLKFELS